MFSGPPLPLLPTLPLHQLLTEAREPGLLGAWVRGCSRTLHLHETGTQTSRIIIGSDLGYLLAHCGRVALREGHVLVVLPAEVVIRWRTLQVVTSSPYLPGLEQLSTIFAGLRSTPTGLKMPVGGSSPEEFLAELLVRGVQIVGSSIMYTPSDPRLGN
jgi:hypothetical protein